MLHIIWSTSIFIISLALDDAYCDIPTQQTPVIACELNEECQTMIGQIDGSTVWERRCTSETVEAVGARCSTKYKGGKMSENICKKNCKGISYQNSPRSAILNDNFIFIAPI